MLSLFLLAVLALELFQQFGDGALAAVVLGELGGRGERAQLGVHHDLLDVGLGDDFLVIFQQVEAGDLQAVEQQAGAARVQVVGGDALQHLPDGVLDGAAVLRVGQLEGALQALSALQFPNRDGAANIVVVVAERLIAQAWAAAADAVDLDVAALVAGLFVRLDAGKGCRHRLPLPRGFSG